MLHVDFALVKNKKENIQNVSSMHNAKYICVANDTWKLNRVNMGFCQVSTALTAPQNL